MTDSDFDVLRAKLHRVVALAFTDIRSMALADGSARQIHALADAVELIPDYLERRRERDLEAIRGGLEQYAAEYGGIAGRYLQTLDMDDTAFNDLYRRTSWDWPAPVSAAAS